MNSSLQGHFQMSLWAEVTNTALIGCERKPPPLNGARDNLGGLLARLNRNDREGALLGAAALVSFYERAGTLPLKDARPSPQVCEPDASPRCRGAAAARLAMMLRGEYKELLPEWLAKTASSGRRAPEELLPQLLELGRLKLALREFVLPALGRRGLWLAAQNPDWSYALRAHAGGPSHEESGISDRERAAPVADEQSWHQGNHEARLTFLRLLRATDAARARELLASTWNEEKPDYRAEFLSVFETGLSLEDEPMLESALDDRSKGVVRTAAKLLIRLPQSRLYRRTIERARPLISLKKKSRGKIALEIAPPQTCDDAMSRDAVGSKPAQGMSQEAWLLRQVVNLTPPSVWNQSLGLSTDELARAALADKEWGEALLESWASAAKLHQDGAWAEALLNQQGKNGFNFNVLRTLFESLPNELKEKYMLKSLRGGKSLEDAYVTLQLCAHQWSEALSLAVLSAICQSVKTVKIKDEWIWIKLFNAITLYLNPDQLPDALSQISAVQKDSKSSNRLDSFLAALQFRYEMLKEIDQ
jgi:uncharacterized protein DUF5691